MRTPLLLLMLALPLKHLQVTSAFGGRVHPISGTYQLHAGVDLRAKYDTVYAVTDGRIDAIGYDRNLGIFIRLTNGPFCFTYGHLSALLVSTADSVNAAAPLAISGMSGRVTGPHLHFAVQFNRRYIDPLAFLQLAERARP